MDHGLNLPAESAVMELAGQQSHVGLSKNLYSNIFVINNVFLLFFFL